MRVYFEPAGSIFFGNSFRSPLWVWFFKAVIALSIILCSIQAYIATPPNYSRASYPTISGHVKGASTSVPPVTPQTTPPTQASGSTASTHHSAVPVATVPQCTRQTIPDLSGMILNGAPGLVTMPDPTAYYPINGYTRNQIANQIQQCSPVSSGHAANTSYIITKSYTTTAATPGICTLTNVKVGLRIRFTYPAWQSSSHDEAGLAQRWQRFSNALATHENGHADLNKQYAYKILTDLAGLAPTDCNSIYTAATAIYQRDLSELRQANEAYDAATNHGATQGAIF